MGLLVYQIKGNFEVLKISETETDCSFPVRNLLIEGFSSPYRLDCDSSGSGILLFMKKDIPSNLFTVEMKMIEGFSLQVIYVTTNC